MLTKRKLGTQGLEVSAWGLGCLGMRQSYDVPGDQESLAIIPTAARRLHDILVSMSRVVATLKTSLASLPEVFSDFVLFLLNLLQNAWVLCWVLIAQYLFQQMKSPLSPRSVNILWGCAIVLVAFEAWRKERKIAREAKQALNEVRVAEPARVFINEPLERLLDLRKGSAELSVWTFLAPYFGKWVRLSGRATALAESLSDDSLYLTVILAEGVPVHLQFDRTAREHLQSLRDGQHITAVCKIVSNPQTRFGLGNCELTGPQATVISTRPLIPFVTRSSRKTG